MDNCRFIVFIIISIIIASLIADILNSLSIIFILRDSR